MKTSLEILRGLVNVTIHDEESRLSLENVTVEIINNEVKMINKENKLRIIFKPLEIEIKKGIAFCYLDPDSVEESLDCFCKDDTLVIQLETGKSVHFPKRLVHTGRKGMKKYCEYFGDIAIFYMIGEEGDDEKFFIRSSKKIFSYAIEDEGEIEILNNVIITREPHLTNFYKEGWADPEIIHNNIKPTDNYVRWFEIMKNKIIIYKHRDTNIVDKIIDTLS